MQEGLRQQKRQTWFDFLVTLAGKQEWANVLEYFMSRHMCEIILVHGSVNVKDCLCY